MDKHLTRFAQAVSGTYKITDNRIIEELKRTLFDMFNEYLAQPESVYQRVDHTRVMGPALTYKRPWTQTVTVRGENYAGNCDIAETMHRNQDESTPYLDLNFRYIGMYNGDELNLEARFILAPGEIRDSDTFDELRLLPSMGQFGFLQTESKGLVVLAQVNGTPHNPNSPQFYAVQFKDGGYEVLDTGNLIRKRESA